jgi:hypothetical protein
MTRRRAYVARTLVRILDDEFASKSDAESS